jgi:hypothetical protein
MVQLDLGRARWAPEGYKFVLGSFHALGNFSPDPAVHDLPEIRGGPDAATRSVIHDLRGPVIQVFIWLGRRRPFFHHDRPYTSFLVLSQQYVDS